MECKRCFFFSLERYGVKCKFCNLHPRSLPLLPIEAASLNIIFISAFFRTQITDHVWWQIFLLLCTAPIESKFRTHWGHGFLRFRWESFKKLLKYHLSELAWLLFILYFLSVLVPLCKFFWFKGASWMFVWLIVDWSTVRWCIYEHSNATVLEATAHAVATENPYRILNGTPTSSSHSALQYIRPT